MLCKDAGRAAPLQELQHLSEAPNMRAMSMRPERNCNATGCQEASDLVAQAKRELNQKGIAGSNATSGHAPNALAMPNTR
jgi:hypothetical protein